MQTASTIAIFTALAEAKVRYFVVGGVAVNAHGFARRTKDLDLVVQLDSGNLLAALSTLGSLVERSTSKRPYRHFHLRAFRFFSRRKKYERGDTPRRYPCLHRQHSNAH